MSAEVSMKTRFYIAYALIGIGMAPCTLVCSPVNLTFALECLEFRRLSLASGILLIGVGLLILPRRAARAALLK